MTNEILKPVFKCRNPCMSSVAKENGRPARATRKLVTHQARPRALSDEPAPSSTNFKTYNHSLGETGTTFCAARKLKAALPNFPSSLNDAPALLPAENTTCARALEVWFREQHLKPRCWRNLKTASLDEGHG